MRVRDLGALAVAVGIHERPVVGTRAAAMLGQLTVQVNQRVPVDVLMSAAWGDRIPPGAASTLVSHIWRLRKLLEPERDRHQPPAVLLSDGDGYRLVGSSSTVDSLLFAETSEEVSNLLAAGHAEAAVRRAESALALWRGQPYGGLADAPWARSAVSRLLELRGQLQEHRIEGLLAIGAVDTALGDLPVLIAAMPFRESIRALQMDALHRSGRIEEALHAFRVARRTLIDELGVEPGPQLRAVHERILRDDPDPGAPVRYGSTPRRESEVHLPSSLTALIGRESVVERLCPVIVRERLVTITGAAGCGKTRVAIEAARAVATDFPDGVWFVDLTAVTNLDLVVDLVVSTIGVAASPGATPLRDLTRYLHSRRMLLVLDNCEHVLPSIDQIVRVSLNDPGGPPECRFLTTSREPIGIVGEIIWTLPPLALPDDRALPAGAAVAPAVQLFLQRLQAVAPELVIDEDVLALAAEISVALDGLPLPIELAAARALSHSLPDIAAQTSADPSRLGRIGRGPRDHRSTLRSAIEWSHRLLSPAEQLAHRRLSVLPGSFTAGPAAAVLGDFDLEVDDLLARLVHRSLLTSGRSPSGGRPTAFRQLATVRSHARHALDEAGEALSCLDRRDAWVAALIGARPPLGSAAELTWGAAIDDDDATVRATLTRQLIDEPSAAGAQLARRLTYHWHYRERLVEAGRWLQLGHRAVRGAGPTEELLTRLAWASTLALQRRPDLVDPLLDDLEAQVRAAPPVRLLEVGEELAGLSVSAYTSEAAELLVRLDRTLRWVGERTADPDLELLVDAVHCCALLVSGRTEAAVELAMRVQPRAEAVDHVAAGFISTAPMIIGALLTNRPEGGLPWLNRCAALQLRFGSGAIGMYTETRANFAAQLGQYDQAARWYGTAYATTRRVGMTWPNRTLTHGLLAKTRAELSRADYERAWQEGEQLNAAELFTDADRRIGRASSGSAASRT